MTLLSMSSRSSVDRAPTRRSGGHGFDSCRGLMLINSLFNDNDNDNDNDNANGNANNNDNDNDKTLLKGARSRNFRQFQH